MLIYEEVEALAAVLRDSPVLTELEVRNGATVVRLRRAPAGNAGVIGAVASAPIVGTLPLAAEAEVFPPTVLVAEAQAPTRVKSTLVGVFHANHSAPVAEGQTVESGQVLGQIEAMRLMNDVAATSDGRVVGVLVQDGQPVQYGQPLFEIDAAE